MEIKKCYDFEVMKFAGLLLVILGHTTVFYTSDGAFPVNGHSTFLQYLCSYIYTFHMPLFMFASGGVYGYLRRQGKYQHFLPFLKNKVKRLLVPYLAFGMLLVYPVTHMLDLTKLPPLEYLWHGLLLKHDARHLWFLYTLLQIFIITWLLEWCCRQLPGFRRIPVWAKIAILACLSLWSAELPIAAQTAKYLFYFYIGKHFLGLRQILSERLKGNRTILFAVFGTLLHLVLCGYYLYWRQNALEAANIFQNLLQMFFALFGTWTVYLWSLALSQNRAFCSSQLLNAVSQNLFAVYLFHAMVIYLFFYFIAPYPLHPYLAVFGACVAGIGLSWVLGILMRKCKLGFLLGE